MKFLPSMLLPFQLLLLLLPSLQVVSFTHSVISLSSTSVQLPSTLLFSAVDGDKDGGTSRSSKKSVQIQPQEPLIFAGVKFHPPISAALKSLSITKPSPIQSASIAAITAGQSCIIHAQTGSGKTLSYVLPVLKRLFGEIDGNENHIFQPLQALILAPTKELAVQVSSGFRIISHHFFSCFSH